jgi:hypothetical protein
VSNIGYPFDKSDVVLETIVGGGEPLGIGTSENRSTTPPSPLVEQEVGCIMSADKGRHISKADSPLGKCQLKVETDSPTGQVQMSWPHAIVGKRGETQTL